MGRRDHLGLALAALLTAAWLAPSGPVLAHADIQRRLADLDRRVAANDRDPGLHLRRGELHRLHRDWPAALADYRRAAALAPDRAAVDFLVGRMWLEAGRPDLARPKLDRFVARRPDHVGGRLTRSRVLGRLGAGQAAAADITVAIARRDPPTPELYLERARHLLAACPDRPDQALGGIDQGIARLGPVVTLIGFAIDVETRHRRYDAALRRLDDLPAELRGQASWLARRADILAAAGREEAARAVYLSALRRIADLPPRRRSVRATAALATRLRDRLGDLGGGAE